MAPDLNSLPPSRSTSASPLQPRALHPSPQPMDPILQRRETPSPRSSSTSLTATATINATDLSRRSSGASRGSPRLGRVHERRRSTVAMNLNLNDPTLPGPGELSSSDHRASLGHSYASASPLSLGGSITVATGDPHHNRTPSLGELHQELEQEQEAQVNRLLQMINAQQLQLEQMQRLQQENQSRQSSSQPTSATTGGAANNSTAIDDSTPTSEFSSSFQSIPFSPLPRPTTARRSSRPRAPGTSNSTSPALRPLPTTRLSRSEGSNADFNNPPSPLDIARRSSSRDESAFYQAETATLTRENQMLRLRIRELERQIAEMNPNNPANTPAVPSNLATNPPVGEGPSEVAVGEVMKE